MLKNISIGEGRAGPLGPPFGYALVLNSAENTNKIHELGGKQIACCDDTNTYELKLQWNHIDVFEFKYSNSICLEYGRKCRKLQGNQKTAATDMKALVQVVVPLWYFKTDVWNEWQSCDLLQMLKSSKHTILPVRRNAWSICTW